MTILWPPLWLIHSSSVTTVQLMAMAFGAAIAGLIANIGGLITLGAIDCAESASILLFVSFAVASLFAALIMLFIIRLR